MYKFACGSGGSYAGRCGGPLGGLGGGCLGGLGGGVVVADRVFSFIQYG